MTSPPLIRPDSLIPIIDFQPFLQGKLDERHAVAQAIREACQGIGFFYLHQHGIDQPLINAAFCEAQRFFALPAVQKRQIAIEQSPCHRGYFAIGGENLDPATQDDAGDFKEGLKIGRDLPPHHPQVLAGLPLHGSNQWPANLPGWRETMQTYYAACEQLGQQLMRAFALALDLPESYFERWLREPMATLGPLHYPPAKTEQQLGAGTHTDYGCLTILAQDDCGGLQVYTPQSQWLDVPPLAGAVVINIGDMLARWSNDLFRSTRHRVINQSGRDRYALAYFYDPEFHTPLQCLPNCCTPEHPPRYESIAAGDYLQQRIREAFTYYD